MLRVGLTGGLGSGKSTTASIFREYGFPVLEADAIARAMMKPGESVYQAIVEHFGSPVVRGDGTLDRARLAVLAFREGMLPELNRIVHPPVIAEQERRMRAIFASDPQAAVIVESALIFEAEAGDPNSASPARPASWRNRFDRVVLVTAPDEVKIQRFLSRILPAGVTAERRAEAERDAQARLAAQLPDDVKKPQSDFIIDNAGSLEATRTQVAEIAGRLRADSQRASPGGSNGLS